MIYQQLIPYLNGAANTCAPDGLLQLVNLALSDMNQCGYWVGSTVRAKVWTFDGVFTLPREMKRALSVQQCDGSIANSGYYQIDAQGIYVDPAAIQDCPIEDLGEGPLEKALLTPSKLYVQAEYAQDAGVTVQVQGLYGDEPVITSDPSGNVAGFEDVLVPESGMAATQAMYASVTSITKPVTHGPIRVMAENVWGQKYLVLIMWPDEVAPQRRRVRFNEVYQCENPLLRASVYSHTMQFDFLNPTNLRVGDLVQLTGWVPAGMNGVWPVSRVVDCSVYFQHQNIPFTDEVPITCSGTFTTSKLLRVTGVRNFVPLSGPNSIVPFQNVTAIRAAVRAQSKFMNDALDQYQAAMEECKRLLAEEVKTYGLDPTDQAGRTEQYRWALQNYPEHSIGAVASRIAMDLRKVVKVPITDMMRYVAEAEGRFLAQGQYFDAIVKRTYQADDDGMIQLEDDCYAPVVARFCCGPRIQLESRYYDYEKEPYLQSNGGLGFGTGGWQYAAGAAGWGCDLPIPYQSDFAARLIDQTKGQWRLSPWRQLRAGGCTPRGVDLLVRLRSTRYCAPQQEMVFRNFAALKEMVEAVMADDLKDVATAQAKEAKAIMLADKDLGASRGGAITRIRLSRWQKLPNAGFVR